MSAYVKRGDPFHVERRLQYRSFQDEEGRERMVTEIVASDIQLLGRQQDRPPSETGASGIIPATAGSPDVAPDEILF